MEEYRVMIALKTWASKDNPCESNQIPKKTKADKDIAARLVSSADTNRRLNVITKAMAKPTKRCHPALN